MQGYCVKCRAKRDMKDPKSITMKNGRPATQGVCPACGTKMFKIGKCQSTYTKQHRFIIAEYSLTKDRSDYPQASVWRGDQKAVIL